MNSDQLQTVAGLDLQVIFEHVLHIQPKITHSESFHMLNVRGGKPLANRESSNSENSLI